VPEYHAAWFVPWRRSVKGLFVGDFEEKSPCPG
jgi:hypothetical protein